MLADGSTLHTRTQPSQTASASVSPAPTAIHLAHPRDEANATIGAMQRIATIDSISAFPPRILEILCDAFDADGGTYCETGAPGTTSFIYCVPGRSVEAASSISVPVRTGKRVEILVTLWRSLPFSADDTKLITALEPSIGQCHAMLRRVDRLARSLSVVSGGRRVATVLVDRDGSISLVDGAASIVTRWFRDGSSLCNELQTWSANQSKRALGEAEPFVAPSVDVVLVAYWRGERRAGALIELEEQIFDGADLRRLGLSAREAEVLALLVVGAEANTIAQRVGSRPGTVKKQIESVYRKLGVHTRRDAVTIAVDAMMNPEP